MCIETWKVVGPRPIQTWKDPVSDVGVFIVEDPPAAIVCFADKVRRMLITIEAYLPQTRSVESTLRVNSNPPRTSPEADQT